MTSALLLLLAASPVDVSVAGCVLDADEVKRIASIELARGPDGARVKATLTCAEGQLEVRVDDPVTNKMLARRTPLSGLPQSTRERFVALAIAELVEASWSELLLPAPHVDEAAPALRREAEQSLPTTRRVRLLAAGGARAFVTRGVLLGGGGVRGHVSLVGPLGVALDLGVEHGEARITNGHIGIDSLSAALFATLRAEWTRVLLTAGPGLRAGGARMVGIPDDPALFASGTVSSGLVGPALMSELALRFGQLEVAFAVEAGVPVVRLEALVDGQVVTGLTGLWLTGTLAVGVRL